jgi:hypothetical protein
MRIQFQWLSANSNQQQELLLCENYLLASCCKLLHVQQVVCIMLYGERSIYDSNVGVTSTTVIYPFLLYADLISTIKQRYETTTGTTSV